VSEQETVRLPQVAPSPHIAAPASASGIMLAVVAALVPTAVWAVYNMGAPAAITFASAIVGCMGTEALWCAVAKRKQTLRDGSALLTGILLAMCMPPMTPWWITFAAGVVAIGLGKMIFGGLGCNLFNPALVGRAFAVISWAGVISESPGRGWFRTLDLPGKAGLDAVTGATRLALAAADRAAHGGYGYDLSAQYAPLLWRNLEGSLGEVSGALLLLGGLVLVAARIVDWRIPAGYIGSVALFSWLTGSNPGFDVLAGGVLLGAFFMATDYVSSPITRNGRLVYAVGCGTLASCGRFFGTSMPDTTTFAILFMNGLAPLIDRAFTPRTYGWPRRG